MIRRTHVKTLAVSSFRNYRSARMEVGAGSVALLGSNGAGKTNILEAISLLAPGRGIRRAAISELDNIKEPLAWGIHATVMGREGEAEIGTGRDASAETVDKRIVKIDGKLARAHTELARIFSLLWLTPQMDNLFVEGNSARRKFLDRLVFSFDGDHAARVAAYEQVMRERNRLLQTGKGDPVWLDALESKMAGHGIAIAVARAHTVSHLNNAMTLSDDAFPKAGLSMTGDVEHMLAGQPALEAEDAFRLALARGRAQDAAAGRALTGIHRSRIEVVHGAKRMQAEYCSTGEQKALLVSIVLAQAKAGALWHGGVPVMLLDEVATHLDAARRRALFAELREIGAQAWLTGTDAETFDTLEAQRFRIENGVVSAL